MVHNILNFSTLIMRDKNDIYQNAIEKKKKRGKNIHLHDIKKIPRNSVRNKG